MGFDPAFGERAPRSEHRHRVPADDGEGVAVIEATFRSELARLWLPGEDVAKHADQVRNFRNYIHGFAFLNGSNCYGSKLGFVTQIARRTPYFGGKPRAVLG